MTVGELKRMLDNYPDEMEVITDRCSDYDWIEEDEWTVVKAVKRPGGCWIMRGHPTMSEEDRANECEFLHLDGN